MISDFFDFVTLFVLSLTSQNFHSPTQKNLHSLVLDRGTSLHSYALHNKITHYCHRCGPQKLVMVIAIIYFTLETKRGLHSRVSIVQLEHRINLDHDKWVFIFKLINIKIGKKNTLTQRTSIAKQIYIVKFCACPV